MSQKTIDCLIVNSPYSEVAYPKEGPLKGERVPLSWYHDLYPQVFEPGLGATLRG